MAKISNLIHFLVVFYEYIHQVSDPDPDPAKFFCHLYLKQRLFELFSEKKGF
jgi:hypothetical protein